MTADLSRADGVTTVSHAGVQGYGFYPGRVRGEGFFIAALRKPAGPAASLRHAGRGAMRPSALAFSRAEPLADFDRSRLIMAGDRIIALAGDADMINYLNGSLTVIKSGTMIGELKNNDLVPAHDLAMSVRQKRGAWPEYELKYDEAISYLRLELAPSAAMPAGRVLVNYRGIPLGFVNNLVKRLNNGYPQSWRIRMEKQLEFKEIL